MPETKPPEAQLTEIKLPEAQLPEVNLPEVQLHEVQLPETSGSTSSTFHNDTQFISESPLTNQTYSKPIHLE